MAGGERAARGNGGQRRGSPSGVVVGSSAASCRRGAAAWATATNSVYLEELRLRHVEAAAPALRMRGQLARSWTAPSPRAGATTCFSPRSPTELWTPTAAAALWDGPRRPLR